MLDPAVTTPEVFAERTRLESGTDLEVQCEAFMRQFARLEGWPRVVSVGSA